MGVPVMILGESGSGKTTSFRNLDPNKVMLFKITNKPLPFKSTQWGKGVSVVTHDWQRVAQGILKAPSLNKQIVLIDDFQYLMAEEFISRANEKNYQKFTDMALHVREVIRAAQNVDDSVRVYMTWHSQVDEQGVTKAKTIGKLLDEKICIEGLFTIVLKSLKRDGQYYFSTQSNGYDVCKSPMGLFDGDLIDNDLQEIDKKICEYYEINQQNNKPKKEAKNDNVSA